MPEVLNFVIVIRDGFNHSFSFFSSFFLAFINYLGLFNSFFYHFADIEAVFVK